MNTAHMTEQDWAQYIQTYEPTNEQELKTYMTDLLNYAKRDSIASGIALLRAKQTSFYWPELLKSREYLLIESEDRSNQRRIQEGFYR